jgi:hypothetical protein
MDVDSILPVSIAVVDVARALFLLFLLGLIAAGVRSMVRAVRRHV